MPRVKIDYVVSVSSEDPEHPASNLVSGEVGRRRWLCGAGAAEGAVLLQLQRAVTICGVHIGSYQAAFVEVLVGTADRPIDQYEVLVPRCVLAGPAESRRAGPGAGAGAERVRSFAAEQLSASARGRRWDRVRLLCSQPYNKHCQFGLSFIHIYEPEAVSTGCTAAEPAPTSAPAPRDTLLSLGTYSSDEDEFRPGVLFAKHRQSLQRKDSAPGGSTDSQIRKASAQALKNIPEADTTLKKVPIEKCSEKREQIERGERPAAAPPAPPAPTAPTAPPRAPSRQRHVAAGRAERAALHGVVFAMSGFVNPERAALRAAGVALGARYRPDWAPDCTHLVCAFPNTPKLKKVSASAPHAHIVSGAWLRACQRRRRREPEAPHALCPRRASPAPAPAPARSPAPAHSTSVNTEDTDDTDDEIEKVRARRKRPPPPPPALSDNDVTFVCDERFKGSVTLSDSEEATEEEEGAGEERAEAARAPLPDFLEGLRFAVAGGAETGGGGCDAGLLARYVRAYGGLLLPESALQQGAAADYVLCAGGAAGAAGGALRVRADWLWRCHELRALAPTRPYELPS